MSPNELIIDAFGRIKEVVHTTVEGLSIEDLKYRPANLANSIAWLIWHLSRIQDDHITVLSESEQIWDKNWYKEFALPFKENATGYGHSSQDVVAVQTNAKLLLGYYDAVHIHTVSYVQGLTSDDYKEIVDKRWDPPVTLGVRLISVISDNMQHAGQAAYIRGLLKQQI